ncbi:hypothetical protein F2Q69_00034320 [Brassica cretica]|uniref:Extensin domain-containing protein n=1 Tax=Brassica cretica TaxID=69181 RepID=A0A8S9SLE3_BRACR|nr:hypothetical protein F2Q69_00034320 [Brassica cretica]
MILIFHSFKGFSDLDLDMQVFHHMILIFHSFKGFSDLDFGYAGFSDLEDFWDDLPVSSQKYNALDDFQEVFQTTSRKSSRRLPGSLLTKSPFHNRSERFDKVFRSGFDMQIFQIWKTSETAYLRLPRRSSGRLLGSRSFSSPPPPPYYSPSPKVNYKSPPPPYVYSSPPPPPFYSPSPKAEYKSPPPPYVYSSPPRPPYYSPSPKVDYKSPPPPYVYSSPPPPPYYSPSPKAYYKSPPPPPYVYKMPYY